MQKEILSTNIKTLRQELHMNQNDFSSAIGITQSTLSNYENGSAAPSLEVLAEIATQFHVSMDWLCGITLEKVHIATLEDAADFLYKLSEIKELRFELDINDHLPDDLETEDNRWYASLIFYGNSPEHIYNADMCRFLAYFEEYREGYESFFTNKEVFDDGMRKAISRYKNIRLSQREEEVLDYKERVRRRDLLMEHKIKSQNGKTKNN